MPASLLLRNNLHVERQRKSRRTMLSFGMTFRNSKWGDYSVQNVLPRLNRVFYTFLRKSVRLTLGVFFLLCCYTFFSQWLINAGLYPYVLVDIIHTLGEGVLGETWHSYLLLPLYAKSIWYLAWEVGPRRALQMVIDGTFITSVKPRNAQQNLDTTSSQQLLDLERPDRTNPTPALKEIPDALDLPVLEVFRVLRYPMMVRPSFDVAMPEPMEIYILQKWRPSVPKYENTLVTKVDRWSAYAICRDMGTLDMLEKATRGPFYLYSLNYNMITLLTDFPELRSTPTGLRDAVKLQKTVRWLYRYSLLHRKSVQRSHFATLTKRLVTSGFYGERFASRNMWAATTFFRPDVERAAAGRVLGANFNLLYGNSTSFSKGVSGGSLDAQWGWVDPTLLGVNRGLRDLQYLEESFYFTLKRWYLFHALPTVVFQSTYRPVIRDASRTVSSDLRAARGANWFILEALLSSLNLLLPNLNFNCLPKNHHLNASSPASWEALVDTFVSTHELNLWQDNVCTTALEITSYTANPHQIMYYAPFPANEVQVPILDFQPQFTPSAPRASSSRLSTPVFHLWRVEAVLLRDLQQCNAEFLRS